MVKIVISIVENNFIEWDNAWDKHWEWEMIMEKEPLWSTVDIDLGEDKRLWVIPLIQIAQINKILVCVEFL